MRPSKATLKYVLLASFLVGAVLILLIVLYVRAKPTLFFTTSSPGKTYTVNLIGQKGRPLFFTVEVHFDVLKNGTPFLSNKYLHSGDWADASFESDYPNHRWIAENTIQFYRQEYFNRGNDTIVVVNKTGVTINYARVESVDKFLVFDLQPGLTVSIVTPRPRGDSKYVWVEGEFADGRMIVGANTNFPEQKDLAGPRTYYVHIYNDRTTVDVRN